MSAVKICHHCNGNGYIGSSKDIHKQKDCDVCMNQGQIVEDADWDFLWNVAQFKLEKK